MKAVSLQFLGAAGTVTGSKHLLKTPELNILVDCGIFQGLKELRLLNWTKLPFPAEKIDVVLLTHAHLDHCGYLPLLNKNGFKGKVLMTGPTGALAEIILKDSARIQEEDARRANEEKYSKHHPALPLYDTEDVGAVLDHFSIHEDNKWKLLSDHTRFRFRRNAHILGATFIELDCHGKRIVFSGDIGRKESLTLPSSEYPEPADFMVVESTYGDKLHPHTDQKKFVSGVINDAVRKHGNVVIPSFAVGRAQELMVLINELKKENAIPQHVPVYLDSPMAINATEVYHRYPGWHKLTLAECDEIRESVIPVHKVSGTLKVLKKKGSKIVIAGAGMVTGGRVLHYLEKYLGDKKNTVLLVGFQAEGTRGRSLQNGSHELKIAGRYFPVRATIENLSSLSAHAGQDELLEWMEHAKSASPKVFLVHGEPSTLQAFSIKIKDTFGWETIVPKLNEEITLFNL